MRFRCTKWSNQIPQGLKDEAERVQTRFLRATLGLTSRGSAGVSDIVVRTEAGCEPLTDRWAKLTLGFWRRLHNAREGRLLRCVAEFRHEECVANTGYGHTGWMPGVRDLLTQGLGSMSHGRTPNSP